MKTFGYIFLSFFIIPLQGMYNNEATERLVEIVVNAALSPKQKCDIAAITCELDAGANPNVIKNGIPLMHWMIGTNKESSEALEALINRGASITIKNEINGKLPIDVAKERENIKAITLVEQSSCKVNTR
jgi:hypothetical protein